MRSLRARIGLILVGLTLLSSFVLIVGTNWIVSDSKEADVLDSISSKRELKSAELELYFTRLQFEVETLARIPLMAQWIPALRDAFRDLPAATAGQQSRVQQHYDAHFWPRVNDVLREPGDQERLLQMSPQALYAQWQYLATNPFPVGEKDKLDAAGSERYSQVHAEVHAFMRQTLHDGGFYDLFLITPEGDMVYSVYKETDFGTNLRTGPYQATGLGRAFQEAARLRETVFIDYSLYLPSYGDAAAFIGVPVTRNGQFVGVFVGQVSSVEIGGVLSNNDSWSSLGLGQIGEVMLVGSDLRLRNQVRALSEDAAGFVSRNVSSLSRREGALLEALSSSILNVAVDHPAVEAALNGESGIAHLTFDGVPSIVSYGPVQIGTLTWAMLVRQGEVEAYASLTSLRLNLALLLLVLLAGTLLGTPFIARAIANPLETLSASAQRVSKGSLNEQVTLKGADELTSLGEAFNEMVRQIAAQQNRLREEQVYLAHHAQKLFVGMEQLAQGDLTVQIASPRNNDTVSGLIERYNTSVSLFARTMQSLVQHVEGTALSMGQMSVATQEVSTTAEVQASQVREVDRSIAEMVSTILEVAQNLSRINEMADRSGQMAAEGAGRVEEVTHLISHLKSQMDTEAAQMSTLVESSKQISRVIQTIEDIAYEINLISLNATIEAARAGEVGAGFSVVARRIRDLSERTRQVTGEVSETTNSVVEGIGTISEMLQQGHKMASRSLHEAELAHQLMQRVLSSSSNTQEVIGNTAAATEELSVTSEQLGDRMAAVSMSITEGATALHQVATSVHHVQQTAEQLEALSRSFKLS